MSRAKQGASPITLWSEPCNLFGTAARQTSRPLKYRRGTCQAAWIEVERLFVARMPCWTLGALESVPGDDCLVGTYGGTARW